MKKALKNIIAAAAIAALPMTPAKAGYNIETFNGTKGGFFDMTSDKELAKDLNLSTRGKFSYDYNGNVSPFGVLDLSYGKDIGPIFECQAPVPGILPRLGIFAQKDIGDVSEYFQATASTDDVVELVNVLKASAKVGTLDMKFSNVALLNIAQDGTPFAVLLNRVGVKAGDYVIGPGLDIKFVSGSEPSYNLGLSVKGSW